MSCRLVSGNLNYSSWTLRAWLGLTAFGIPFGEDRIPLFEGDWRRRIIALIDGFKTDYVVADRGYATRYERLAQNYLSVLQLVATVIWLKQMRTPARKSTAFIVK